MSEVVCVPIKSSIYNEFILRTGRDIQVATWIENILEDFLERTKHDHPEWCEAYYQSLETGEDASTKRRYGDPEKGYQWQNVFLPNRTKLRVVYKGATHIAEVRHSQIFYLDRPCSPSEFASQAANNTSRNAWRDIWARLPGDDEWQLANVLRKKSKSH